MRNKLFFSLICLSFYAVADPFYGESQATAPNQNGNNAENATAKSMEKVTACQPSDDVKNINLNIHFNQLKLVGIIKSNEQFKALFIDDKNQIFDFSPKDYLTQGSIQIEDIDFKSVNYIDWQNSHNCQNPILSTIKF